LAAPPGFEEMQILLLIIPTGLGFVLGFTCIHEKGSLNKLVGIAGIAWFGVLFVWVIIVNALL
jgi:hypothetical protein